MNQPPTKPQEYPKYNPMANPKLYNHGFMLAVSMNRLTKAQLSLETNHEKTKLGDKSKSVGEVRGGKSENERGATNT